MQGEWTGTGRNGYIYTSGGDAWLAIADTASAPSRTSSHWVLLTSQGTYQGAWLAGTQYQVGDVVQDGGEFYRCAIGHTSGNDREQDEDLGRWLPDTFPAFLDVGDDSLGINTPPSAVLHAMSYQNHRYADQVIKMERFEDGDVFLNISSNGS